MTIGERIKERRLKLGLTLADLSNRASVSRQTIFKYENGVIKNIPSDKIELIASGLDVSPGYLMGWEERKEKPKNVVGVFQIGAPTGRSVPILGRISCGNGAFTDECFEGEFLIDSSLHADYCLIARGDSMEGAGIDDGDKVFLRKADEYKDGSIYGVVIKGENLTALKKVYHIKDQVMLQPCNPDYQVQVLPETDVMIVGECVGVLKIMK